MDPLLLTKKLKKILKERTLLATLLVVSILINLVCSLIIFRKQEKVIIVPATISREFWIENDSSSKEYIEEMAVFFVNLLLDCSPSSMKYQKEIILKHTDPRLYNKLNNKLTLEEELFRKENLTTSFRMVDLKVNRTALSATITGILTTNVSDKQVSKEEKTFRLCFCMKNGRLFIKSISEPKKAGS